LENQREHALRLIVTGAAELLLTGGYASALSAGNASPVREQLRRIGHLVATSRRLSCVGACERRRTTALLTILPSRNLYAPTRDRHTFCT
jgi:hypothetical protein